MMSQRSQSTTSSTSPSFDAGSTPLSSIDQQSFQFDTGCNADQPTWLDTGPTLGTISVSPSGRLLQSPLQTLKSFDFVSFPEEAINAQNSLGPVSSPLPLGSMTSEFYEMTGQIACRDSVPFYFKTWNGGTLQPTTPALIPDPTSIYDNPRSSKRSRGSIPESTSVYDNPRSSKRSRGSHLLPPMPSHVSTTGASYHPAETSGEMASQVSEPPGSMLWPTWSEQPNDTWRQS